MYLFILRIVIRCGQLFHLKNDWFNLEANAFIFPSMIDVPLSFFTHILQTFRLTIFIT